MIIVRPLDCDWRAAKSVLPDGQLEAWFQSLDWSVKENDEKSREIIFSHECDIGEEDGFLIPPHMNVEIK
jgi:hypothetical protein